LKAASTVPAAGAAAIAAFPPDGVAVGFGVWLELDAAGLGAGVAVVRGLALLVVVDEFVFCAKMNVENVKTRTKLRKTLLMILLL
jgi:hypothetical protein